jgi:hypothetical protein
MDILVCYEIQDNDFFWQIVITDTSYVYHFLPKTKHTSYVRLHCNNSKSFLMS